MIEKRFLILMFEKYLISFYLVNKKGSDIKILHKKHLRLYKNSFDFNISEYILDFLHNWGKDIGLDLVKENVPIIDKEGDRGVYDIFIFSPKRKENFCALTKRVYKINDDIKQEGALNVSKFFEFQNLLFISLGSLETSVVRYFMQNRNTMKVVVEKKDFKIKKYLYDDEFKENVLMLGQLLGEDSIIELLANIIDTPVFNVKYIGSALIEYFLNELRLNSFRKCSKLQLHTFGSGRMDENLLIIGGERRKIINNDSLEVLSILDTLDLKGNFSVYIDKYGFFDILQRCKKQLFKDKFYRSYLLEFWGNIITIEGDKRAKPDDIVADVDVLNTESERQVIPMFERIVSFCIEENADVKINTRDRFFIPNSMKTTEMQLKSYIGNFMIDGRTRPLSKNFNALSDSRKADKLRGWFKGLSVI